MITKCGQQIPQGEERQKNIKYARVCVCVWGVRISSFGGAVVGDAI